MDTNTATYPFTLFYDSSCPLCRAEMSALRQRDVLGQLRFDDVCAPGFAAPAGTTRAAMLEAIHGRTADGRWVVGVEAMRLAYGGVGLGWLTAPTAWPGLRRVAERGYRWLARHRHEFPRWVGPACALLLGARARMRREAEQAARRAHCDGDTCAR